MIYNQKVILMKYFNFDQLNPITHYLNNSSYIDQIYSHEHWFNFKVINEKADQFGDLLLLIPLSLLLYLWIMLFSEYDKAQR